MKTEGNEPISPKGDPQNAADYPTYGEFLRGGTAPSYGLTKREFFAAMAMQGILASGQATLGRSSHVAGQATGCADALIQALNDERK